MTRQAPLAIGLLLGALASPAAHAQETSATSAEAQLEQKLITMARALKAVQPERAPERHRVEVASAKRALITCTRAVAKRTFHAEALSQCYTARGWVALLEKHLPDDPQVQVLSQADRMLATVYLYLHLQGVEREIKRLKRSRDAAADAASP